jgi:hypothetical protein
MSRLFVWALAAAGLLSVSGLLLGIPNLRAAQDVARSHARLTAENAGWDAVVNGIVSAFDEADVVALAATRGRMGSDLRIRLVRQPDFPKRVRSIIVEWGNSIYQPVLDRYIDGDDVPATELQRLWRDQTQVASWDSAIHANFFAAVREVNRSLPRDKRLRVLGGDSPIDWSKVNTNADYMRFAGADRRDESLASVLSNQVLKKREKALVIYGGAHFKAVKDSAPGRVFVVYTMGGSSASFPDFERALLSRERPILVSLKGTRAAAFAANLFPWGARRFVQGKEVPLFAPTVTLGDLADACVYYGQGPEADAYVDPEPDPGIYEGTPYGAEVARRKRLR